MGGLYVHVLRTLGIQDSIFDGFISGFYVKCTVVKGRWPHTATHFSPQWREDAALGVGGGGGVE